MNTRGRCGLCLLVAVLWVGLASCGTPVQILPGDATAPAVTMDVYGVPLPSQGMGITEVIQQDSSCCDIARVVPLAKAIDFVASGEDKDGGVKSVSILARVDVICFASVGGETFHENRLKVADNADNLSSPPATGTSFRATQGSLRLKEPYEGGCSPGIPLWISAHVTATALNYSGGATTTKEVSLAYPSIIPPSPRIRPPPK